MKRIKSALQDMEQISVSYEMQKDGLEELQETIDEAKVNAPIIGRFSSGKSALINTLLGYSKKVLKEDVTPETAIPAEITYEPVGERVEIVRNDGSLETLKPREYRDYQMNTKIDKFSRLYLNNKFLANIPDVTIVDMPGFESGHEVHNRAIDDYVKNAMVYTVAVPADDMIIKQSLGNILKELCHYNMPLCVVITKWDKRNVEEFDASLDHLKESLKKFVGDREVAYCRTSSACGDVEELEQFFEKIQEDAQNILFERYKVSALSIAENIKNYLLTVREKSGLSDAELEEEKEKLNKQMTDLDEKISGQQEKFDIEAAEAIEAIKADILRALESEESTFVTMAMNGQSIKERMNTLVREVVASSVQRKFSPKMEKYLQKVSKTISNESFGDASFYFEVGNTPEISKGIATSLGAGIGAIIFTGLPVVGVFVAGAVAIIKKLGANKKLEKVRQQLCQKLRCEVFPQVLNEVGKVVDIGITKQVMMVKESIDNELKIQQETLNQAMDDICRRREEQEKSGLDINRDLERIGEIIDELR